MPGGDGVTSPSRRRQATPDDPVPPRGDAARQQRDPEMDVLFVVHGPFGRTVSCDRVGGLKLFVPKTMCPLIAVRDRKER